MPTIQVSQSYGAIALGVLITDDGGDASIAYSVSSGLLPSGITLNSDGTFSGSAVAEGAGNVTFAATNSGGSAYSTSAAWLVNGASLPDAPLAAAIWGDEFDYVATRTEAWSSGADNPFTATGRPWRYAKDLRVSDPGAGGYVYTVDPTTDIPGNVVNPSARSSRVLCLEALPATYGRQTDFYLQRGYPEASDDDVLPANVWIQHWLYIPRSGAQQSQISNRGLKFLYPCRDGHGSCHTMSWLEIFKTYSTNPTCAVLPDFTTGFFPINVGDNHLNDDILDQTTTNCDGNVSEIGVTGDDPALPSHSNVNYMGYNTWYLIKSHFDTSGSAGARQVFVRAYGSSTWATVADWRSGVTPTGFTWTIAPANQRGHNVFRLGTTFDDFDAWLYIADFAVATAEADLHVYSDAE